MTVAAGAKPDVAAEAWNLHRAQVGTRKAQQLVRSQQADNAFRKAAPEILRLDRFSDDARMRSERSVIAFTHASRIAGSRGSTPQPGAEGSDCRVAGIGGNPPSPVSLTRNPFVSAVRGSDRIASPN